LFQAMFDLDGLFFHVNINVYSDEEVQAQKEVVIIKNYNHKCHEILYFYNLYM
jgi:hypothetical protein